MSAGAVDPARARERAPERARGAASEPRRVAAVPGFTGGQYSLWRALFGAYLALHFALLVPYGAEVFSSSGMLPDAGASPLVRLFPNVLALHDSPAFVTALLAAAAVASAAVAAGWRDRAAAVLVWYAWACLYGRNPLIANPGLPYVGWLLLAHALTPAAPFGSLAARARVDPRGGWYLPRSLWVGAWVLMAVGYSYSGLTKLDSPSWLDGTAFARVLENPLTRPGPAGELARALPAPLLVAVAYGGLAAEILFAPLALFSRTRPWIWLALLAMHLGLVVLVDFADLSLGMIVLHLFTFDPRWLPPPQAGEDAVFYDGTCGVCHRAVRFAIAEEPTGAAFRFAPLGGPTFEAAFAPSERAALPDSVVVRTADGRTLVRSEAALRVLARCGGAWRAIAAALRLVPRSWRDRAYDLCASVRYRLFARPKEACPLFPRELANRFRA